jgi:hypothetical protein
VDEKTSVAPAASQTPGRAARNPASGWARADLLRRVQRLPIPPETRARVARFVEEEIARARSEWTRDAVPLDGLACPACQAPIDEKLRAARREETLVEAIRSLGLEKLSPEELERALGKAKG